MRPWSGALKANDEAVKPAGQALREQLSDVERVIRASNDNVDEAFEKLKDTKMDSPEAARLRDRLLSDHEQQKSELQRTLADTRDLLGSSNLPGAKEDPYALIKAFVEEFNGLNELLKLAGLNPVLARVFVRVLCSLLEGLVYHMKERTFARAQHQHVELTLAEKRLVQELDSLPQARRVVAPAKFRMKTRANLRATIAFRRRISNSTPPLVDNLLPPELAIVVAVRDRLTHPKRSTDFRMSSEEMKAVAKVGEWSQQLLKWSSDQERIFIDEIAKQVSASLEAQRARILERSNTEAQPEKTP
jgi:hypothetical protein